jgi:hypothetical protein
MATCTSGNLPRLLLQKIYITLQRCLKSQVNREITEEAKEATAVAGRSPLPHRSNHSNQALMECVSFCSQRMVSFIKSKQNMEVNKKLL